MEGQRLQTGKMPVSAYILAIVLSACGAPDPLASLPQGETGRVVRIIDGDALVLDTGLTVRLVGMEAPAPERRNRTGEPYADKSSRLLEDLSLGRQVRLIYPGITRDRYDRALAYVTTDDALGPKLWLNQEMLRRGGARARFYPDTSALGDLLLHAEAEARAMTSGLWAFSAYDIVSAAEMEPSARGFFIITGTLGARLDGDTDRAVCVRRLTDSNMTVSIQNGAAALCATHAPRVPSRFRGYIRDQMMEITHTLNVEPLILPDN